MYVFNNKMHRCRVIISYAGQNCVRTKVRKRV